MNIEDIHRQILAIAKEEHQELATFAADSTSSYFAVSAFSVKNGKVVETLKTHPLGAGVHLECDESEHYDDKARRALVAEWIDSGKAAQELAEEIEKLTLLSIPRS